MPSMPSMLSMLSTSVTRLPRRAIFVVAAAAIITFLLLFARLDNNSSIWKNIPSFPSSGPGQPDQPAVPVTSDFPPEYSNVHEERQLCDRIYGPQYLTTTATRVQSYCDTESEPKSQSTFRCFLAPRLPYMKDNWESDPLCLAEGVYISPPRPDAEPGKPNRDVTIHCRPRNITAEKLSTPEAAKAMEEIPDMDKLGKYWFNTGVGEQLPDWTIEATASSPECTKSSSNDKWILLVRREGNVNLWHKLMEIWQAHVTLDILRVAVNPATGSPYLPPEKVSRVQIVFEDDREEPLDFLWEMLTPGNLPTRKSALEPGCYGHVVLPLAGSSSPYWSMLLDSTYHNPCHTDFLLDTFTRRMFSFLDMTPRSPRDVHDDPTITIINRTKKRKFYDFERLTGLVRSRYPKSVVNVVDFGEISLKEQIQLIQETDVLVGHHGGGLTHVLFLPSDAAVVEILPPKFFNTGFRHVARSRGLAHFIEHCLFAEEWNNTVNGVPLPEGWKTPDTEHGWQEWQWVYITDEAFLGALDAAVANQKNWKSRSWYLSN